ncbi:hypothetical protein [Pseudoalteromonas sp. T1lg10]|uniref:hypothetical protein n=1 Tax=Pseudoalteromonas sp. T1lg10 TaxID=2077093 RepID=UPI000CF63874|nr:hypothetical protein [Pseudoalteromonas sp. T1lg10]
MWFNFFGTLNTCFILFSLLGVYSQVRTIWRRKQEHIQNPTHILSLKMFMVSFFAYYSFFVYGMSIEPFNHYIVWPRLCASVLVSIILYEIWRDRKTRPSFLCFSAALALLLIGALFGVIGTAYEDQGQQIMAVMIVCITGLIAHGYYSQITLVLKAGETGALDRKMSAFILLMDISTIAFSLSMGLTQGWPLLLLASVSAITKIAVLYLFRWVRFSPIARARRAAQKEGFCMAESSQQ